MTNLKTTIIPFIALWVVSFIALTFGFNSGGEIGYSGHEWAFYFGLPNWLEVSGYWYQGFWKSIGNGTWGVYSASALLLAVLIAALPPIILMLGYNFVRKYFRKGN